MKLSCFFALLIFTTQAVLAEDLLDGFYNHLTKTFSAGKCQNPSHVSGPSEKPCADSRIQSSNQGDLQSFSETAFYNRLSDLEIDRLKCATDEWDSYSAQSAQGKINQDFMVAKMNHILPDLQFLKNEIGRLVGEAHLLRSKIPRNSEGQQLSPKEVQIRDEVSQKNEFTKKLMAAYEMRLSEIPNSDHPLVRDFLEDHLSTFSFKKEPAPVTGAEFEKLTKEIGASFKNSINDLQKLKSGGTYKLSIRQQAQFSSDPTLIAQLTHENPAAADSLPYLQCSAKNRMQTKELTELAATGVSMLLPMGVLGVARAARAAAILRAPQMAKGFEQGARALGWASMITGGLQTSTGIFNACFNKSRGELKGQCRQSPQNLFEKHESSSCIWEAMLAATPGISKLATGYLVRRTADNTSLMARFVEKMAGRKNLRAQDLDVAGSLKREDRLLAAEGILARQLSTKEKDALMSAHEVGGLKSFGHYTDAEISEKRAILKAAGFSERESETLLWKGVAGFNRAEILPLAQKRATEFFGKPITTAQADAIVSDRESISKLTREARQKALTDAGFTPAQAQEIMEFKLDSAGSLSATLKAAAPPPPPPPKPVVPQNTSANPFAQKPTYGGSPVPTGLERLGNGGNITDTEARMALSGYASANGIKGASAGEINFKAMEKLADQTFTDAKNVERALDNTRLTAPERKALTETYDKIKARCKELPTLALRAGLNGISLQDSLKSRIRQICD